MNNSKSLVLASLAFCAAASLAPLLVEAASVKPEHSMQDVRHTAFGRQKQAYNEFRFDKKKQAYNEFRFFEHKPKKKQRIDKIALGHPVQHVHSRGCGHDTPSQDVPLPGTLALLALGLAGLGIARRRSGGEPSH